LFEIQLFSPASTCKNKSIQPFERPAQNGSVLHITKHEVPELNVALSYALSGERDCSRPKEAARTIYQ